MKYALRSLVYTFVYFTVVGCGIASNAEKTLEQVIETNRKMDHTNDGIDKTNVGIDKTNQAVHTQTLAVALNSLLAPENTSVLTPPTDMIPFADKFTEEATPKEIIQTFHLLYTSVMKGFDAEANGDKRIQRRQIRLTAASALAAMAPADKANEIFATQLGGEGEYFDSAFVFMMSRYNFTRDYLLKPILDPNRTPTVELLSSGKKHFTILKEIANSQYIAKLRECPADILVPLCKLEGKLKMSIPEFIVKNKETNEIVALEDTLNPLENKSLGKAAVRKFDDKNNPKMQTPEAQAMIQAFK